ncbi:MAG: pilus assembly protein N-terminal domain-containing protein [Armatimonadetes bacterium]|nr:pilus assembly protein N-terminal domain-containing protein [Armatimonadota bacterium]
MQARGRWLRKAALLFAIGLLAGGLAPGAGTPPGPTTALRAVAGRPVLLSFPSVRQAEVLPGSGLTVTVLSPTAVRVTPDRPGEAVLRVRTASGWQWFRVRAAANPLLAAPGGSSPAAIARAGRPGAGGAGSAAARLRDLLGERIALAPVASPSRLVLPEANAPRLDPGRRQAVLYLQLSPYPVAIAAGPPSGADRLPLAVTAQTIGTTGTAGAMTAGPAQTGARPVLAAARTIPGLPEPAEEVPNTPIPVRLVEGRSRILAAVGLRTVQIDDAAGAMAEVQPISDKEVLLLGRGPGSTLVRIWDARGRTEYEVTVEPSPARRQKAIQDAIGIAGIRVRMAESAAILEGDAASLEQAARAQNIAEEFAPKVINLLRVPPPTPPQPSLVERVQAVLPPGEVTAEALPGQPTAVVLRGRVPRVEDMDGLVALVEKVAQTADGTVLNLIQLADPRQVRIQARMVSVDTNLLRELGIQWPNEVTFTQQRNVVDAAGQFFPEGGLRLFTPLEATVKAMIEDSRSNVLAAPSLVVNSGGVGTIQVGGELPLPTVVTGVTGAGQAGVGTVGQSVSFRPFGVQLTLEPVVRPAGEVTLRLVAESSAIDRANTVLIDGTAIPGFTTKRAATELGLRGGDTLVIGGLISREDAEAVRKFPILGDIPVLGAFFRSVRKEKQSRELFLFVTPEVLPGPEPPAGLRQQPVLKPGTFPPFTSPLTGVGGTGGVFGGTTGGVTGGASRGAAPGAGTGLPVR